MSAHRSRHGMGSGGLRVSDLLAQVSAGSGGTASVQSQRSVFAVAAAAAVGAGTAAAAATGAFPAIQAPNLPGLSDTQSFHRIIEPAAVSTPTPASTAGTALASTPAQAATPAHLTSLSSGHSAGAPGGTVMASDLHQSDARQIAALSHAVSMTKTVTQHNPTSLGSAAGSVGQAAAQTVSNAAQAVTGLVGGAVSALSLPSSLNGVPVSGAAGSKVAALALRQAVTKKGLPYIWGGTGPRGYDCSGLIQWAYKQLGIKLPRTSTAQSQVGTPVSKANLRPGDLVFFYSPVSHVGIYIGNNKIFNASETGEPLKVSDMSHMPFHNARRIS